MPLELISFLLELFYKKQNSLLLVLSVFRKNDPFSDIFGIFEIFFKKFTFLTKPLSESKVEKPTKNQKSENPVEKWYNCAKNIGKLVLVGRENNPFHD